MCCAIWYGSLLSSCRPGPPPACDARPPSPLFLGVPAVVAAAPGPRRPCGARALVFALAVTSGRFAACGSCASGAPWSCVPLAHTAEGRALAEPPKRTATNKELHRVIYSGRYYLLLCVCVCVGGRSVHGLCCDRAALARSALGCPQRGLRGACALLSWPTLLTRRRTMCLTKAFDGQVADIRHGRFARGAAMQYSICPISKGRCC